MADDVKVKLEFSSVEKMWIVEALRVLRASLVRSRSKERSGSEVEVIRGREILEVDRLAARF